MTLSRSVEWAVMLVALAWAACLGWLMVRIAAPPEPPAATPAIAPIPSLGHAPTQLAVFNR